jgi:hypothetical protein
MLLYHIVSEWPRLGGKGEGYQTISKSFEVWKEDRE